jgi:cytochrome c peroxidase
MTRTAAKRASAIALVISVGAGSLGVVTNRANAPGTWTPEEAKTIQTLALRTLGPLPPDPSNRVANDPRAARLGRAFFFDARFSSNGKVACATCHLPNKQFQDGLPLGRGVGTTGRRTMSIVGTSYSPWLFWDGRTDSQWSQALGPLESAVEHGGTRALYASVLAASYRDEYEALFGPLPSLDNVPRHAGPNGTAAERAAWSAIDSTKRDSITRAFANIGKAIAAFERTIQFAPSRFDEYVASLDSSRASRQHTGLTPNEIAGLKLFIGRAKCVNCHSGPLFTDNTFHNVGITDARPDSGRAVGVRQVLAGEFNCLGRYSDAKGADCAELAFAVVDGPDLVGAFRTPSLRGVVQRPPYGHSGRFKSLATVLDHYNRAPRATFGASELLPLQLTTAQMRELEQFLATLSPRR